MSNPDLKQFERGARNPERGNKAEYPVRSTANNSDLKQRTKRFALDVIKFFEGLPKDETSRVLGRQLLRSGTSVGANYRAAKRAKSNADFINKMTIVEEEADESGYWLELLTESEKVAPAKTAALFREANELVTIAVASINTARRNGRKA